MTPEPGAVRRSGDDAPVADKKMPRSARHFRFYCTAGDGFISFLLRPVLLQVQPLLPAPRPSLQVP